MGSIDSGGGGPARTEILTRQWGVPNNCLNRDGLDVRMAWIVPQAYYSKLFRPPPKIVAAYRGVYGRWPVGWVMT